MAHIYLRLNRLKDEEDINAELKNIEKKHFTQITINNIAERIKGILGVSKNQEKGGKRNLTTPKT